MTINLFIPCMLWVFFFVPEGLVRAQNISTVVMEIKAEVIAGASFSQNNETGLFLISGEEIGFGEFSLMIPDGTEVFASSPGMIEMTSDSYSWIMQTKMENIVTEDGTINIRFSTRATNSGIVKDLYKGTQTATIEYL